jgi:hypothetical protein
MSNILALSRHAWQNVQGFTLRPVNVCFAFTEAGPSGAIDPKAAYDERASGGYGRATLVICPLVAVLQWRQEIERFTAPGTLKVCSAQT